MSATARTGRITEVLRSIEHAAGKVSVEYRYGDLEVMVVEVAAGGMLSDPSLYGRSAWHLVLEGQATLTAGEDRWELVPGESLWLDEPVGPCTIHNPSHERLRVLSIVVGGDAPAKEAVA